MGWEWRGSKLRESVSGRMTRQRNTPAIRERSSRACTFTTQILHGETAFCPKFKSIMMMMMACAVPGHRSWRNMLVLAIMMKPAYMQHYQSVTDHYSSGREFHKLRRSTARLAAQNPNSGSKLAHGGCCFPACAGSAAERFAREQNADHI
eukprot:3333372-Rhodomonas_salina.1